MDTNTYNLVMAITFCILTIAAIFIPLFFSIRSSNRTDDTLKDIIRIIIGVESQTNNILSEIKDSSKKDINRTLSELKNNIKRISLDKTKEVKVNKALDQKFSGLTNSIDNTFNINSRQLGGMINPDIIDRINSITEEASLELRNTMESINKSINKTMSEVMLTLNKKSKQK